MVGELLTKPYSCRKKTLLFSKQQSILRWQVCSHACPAQDNQCASQLPHRPRFQSVLIWRWAGNNGHKYSTARMINRVTQQSDGDITFTADYFPENY